MMIQTPSNGARTAEAGAERGKISQHGRLGRVLLKIRPLFRSGDGLATPRRSVDRELQENWPVDTY